MNCPLCLNTGIVQCCDVWLGASMGMTADQVLAFPRITDFPCPKCFKQKAADAAEGLTLKNGQPYHDGPIIGFRAFKNKFGQRMVVPVTDNSSSRDVIVVRELQ